MTGIVIPQPTESQSSGNAGLAMGCDDESQV
jgi:hypothetical protein